MPLETESRFLASAFFAEDGAAPVIERLLALPCPADERARLVRYAEDEARHARLIDELLERRRLPRGEPFVIQRFFEIPRSRASLLATMYHVELTAGVFYGAVAARTDDPEIRSLLRVLLRDEANHIKLHRELLARELARSGWFARARARALGWVLGRTFELTAWLQARELRALLGADRDEPVRKVRLHLRRAGSAPCSPRATARTFAVAG